MSLSTRYTTHVKAMGESELDSVWLTGALRLKTDTVDNIWISSFIVDLLFK